MRAVLTLSSMLLLLVVLWVATERPMSEVGAQTSTRSEAVSILVGSRGHMLPKAKLDGSDEYFEDAICVGDMLLKKPAIEVGLCLALLGPKMELLSFEIFDVAASSEQVQQLVERVGSAPKDTLLVASINGFVQASEHELEALDDLCRALGSRVSPFRSPQASWALIAARLSNGWVSVAESYSEERAVNLAFTLDTNFGVYRQRRPSFYYPRTRGHQEISLYHSRGSTSSMTKHVSSSKWGKIGRLSKPTLNLNCNNHVESLAVVHMRWDHLGLGKKPVFETSLAFTGDGDGSTVCRLLVNGELAASITLPDSARSQWVPWSVDLSAWAGQSVSLQIESTLENMIGKRSAKWGDPMLKWISMD